MATKAAAAGNSYLWEGVDKNGKKVTGEMPSQTEALVRATLRRQGIRPGKIKKKAKPLFGGGKGKIKSKDIAVFSRQLATMMTSGVPLVQAFEIIGRGHDNPGMAELIMDIKGEVEAGNGFTDALRKHPKQFSDLYCNLIQAGEQAGILEAILNKLSTYLEKTEALKSKIKAAMFYPTAVIVVSFIIVTVLMVFVIPQFQELFSSFGADLPALTQFLVDTSDFFQKKWYVIFGGIFGGVWGFLYIKKSSRAFGHFLDVMSMKLPVLGPVLEKSAIARFCRTLETMFAAGTPLVEALDSVAGACGNVLFYKATMKMKDEVSTGTQLQSAMSGSGLFPNMVVQMVAIGEESGAIDTMLGKVADWYEAEVDDAVDAMTSLMEPLIMVFLGGILGTIIIGMYLPIFSMGSAI